MGEGPEVLRRQILFKELKGIYCLELRMWDMR